MQKYYSEHHLEKTSLDSRDVASIFVIIILSLCIVYFIKSNKLKNIENTAILSQYNQERFLKAPSKQARFANKNYDIVVSELLVDDSIRRLKYKFNDLNKSLSSFQSDLLKQQAMNDIILMLRQVKSGDLSNFDTNKMQQAILEAGYGEIDEKALNRALQDYQEKVLKDQAISNRLAQEQARTKEKIKNDSKDAVILAKDIARELAEEEIEGFIENISILARIGSFVVDKVTEE